MFSRSTTSLYNCLVLDDPSTGRGGFQTAFAGRRLPRVNPSNTGSIAAVTAPEWSADQSRGHLQNRDGRLIVCDGLSGMIAKRPCALLPSELSQRTGRKIELYNEAMAGSGGSPRSVCSALQRGVSGQAGYDPLDSNVLGYLDTSRLSCPNDGMPVDRRPGGTIRRLVKEALAKKPPSEAMRALSMCRWMCFVFVGRLLGPVLCCGTS